MTSAMKTKFCSYIALGATLILTSQLFGQSSAEPAADGSSRTSAVNEFEAATIKPGAVDPGGYRHLSLNVAPNGRVEITNWSLKQLICAAYNLSYWQLQGGDTWEDRDLYDVEAKPADPVGSIPAYSTNHDNWSLADPNLRTMLQNLLKDRFALKVHVSAKTGSVYILERSGKELALTPSKHPRGLGWVGFAMNGRVLANASTDELATYLSGYVFRTTVINRTGLTGLYDFQSKPLDSSEDLTDTTRILPAVNEMGLKLTRSTGPVETLVIDQATHPSAN
jgi:uncharacterized protein (TIGR03435 family)